MYLHEPVTAKGSDDQVLAAATRKWAVLAMRLKARGFDDEAVKKIGEVVQPVVVSAAETPILHGRVGRMERALDYAELHCPACDEDFDAKDAVLVKYGVEPFMCNYCAEATREQRRADAVEDLRAELGADELRRERVAC